MELISKEDVIREISLLGLPANDTNYCVKAYNEAIERSQDAISQISVIESRPKGKWIDNSEDGYAECPFCDSATNCDGNIEELHYCWNCGAELSADVRGEE